MRSSLYLLLSGLNRPNLLVNSEFAGAVTGTPGTAPTGWGLGFSGGTTTAGTSTIGASVALAARHFYISNSIVLAAGDSATFSVNILSASGAAADTIASFNPSVGSLASTSVMTVATGTGRHSITCTAGASGATIQARIGVGTGGNTAGVASATFTQPKLESGTTATRYRMTL